MGEVQRHIPFSLPNTKAKLKGGEGRRVNLPDTDVGPKRGTG